MAAQNRHRLERLRRGNIRQPLEPPASDHRDGRLGAGPQGFSLPVERRLGIARPYRILVHRWRSTGHYRTRVSVASVDLDAATFARGARLVVGTGKTPSPALDSCAARRNRRRTETGEDSSKPAGAGSDVIPSAGGFPRSAKTTCCTGRRPLKLVESRGVEPLTFSLRTRRSTN